MRTFVYPIILITYLCPYISFSQSCDQWLKLPNQPSFVKVGDLDITGNQLTIEATFNRTTTWNGSDLYQGDLVSKHEGPNDCNYLLRPGSAEVLKSNALPDENISYNTVADSIGILSAPAATADFVSPDTICINSPINITNTSTGASSYYWNFCVADINVAPGAVNIGNPGNLSNPVFIDYAYYGGNHYGFLINYYPGNLIRLDFGSSLLNTPTSTVLGNFGGIIPTGSGTEGIQIVFNEGKWYAIIVGGTPAAGNSPRILKIDFGPDLLNINPIATNWGNVGNMLLPIDLHVFQENSNWYGFTVNSENNTITRFNFTNSFDNIPTAISFSIGDLQYPTGIYAINDNGFWRVFIVNGGDNTRTSNNCSLTRLDFGSSLLNTPVGVNLGNPGNVLQHPRDLTIMKFCNQIIGYAVNGNPNYNDIIKMDFNNDLLSVPNITTLGNIGNFNFPHSISKLFRVENDIYGFVTNVSNNTITRLKFNGCNSSSISSSNLFNPPPISYNLPGTYYINLIIDDGLPTQSTICKQVVVVSGPPSMPIQDTSLCQGSSVKIGSSRNSNSYLWSTGASTDSIIVATSGTYWIESRDQDCYVRDSVKVIIKGNPIVSLGNDTLICKGESIFLNAGDGSESYKWQDLTTNQTLISKDSGIYYVTAIKDGCFTSDTIHIAYNPDPIFNVMPDTAVCNNSSFTISTQANNNYTYSWSPAAGLSNANISNPIVFVSDTMTYFVTATNSFGCNSKDSISIFGLKTPTIALGNDTLICPGQSLSLDAQNAGASYIWSNGVTSQTTIVENPGMYYVMVNDNNCSTIDSITVSIKRKPIFNLNPATVDVCENDPLQLKAGGGDTYRWFINESPLNNSDSIITVHPNISNLYSVIIDEIKCGYSDTLYTNITIKSKPFITLSKSNDIYCGKPQSQLLATGGLEYFWSPAIAISNVTIPNPIVSPVVDTWYTVEVSGANGCKGLDSIKLVTVASPDEKFYIPSAFTPNNDGKNDCIRVKYAGQVNKYEFAIFNRWGAKVYSTNNINDCWDGAVKGKLQSNEVFIFILKASTNCGDVFEKGVITLIK